MSGNQRVRIARGDRAGHTVGKRSARADRRGELRATPLGGERYHKQDFESPWQPAGQPCVADPRYSRARDQTKVGKKSRHRHFFASLPLDSRPKCYAARKINFCRPYWTVPWRMGPSDDACSHPHMAGAAAGRRGLGVGAGLREPCFGGYRCRQTVPYAPGRSDTVRGTSLDVPPGVWRRMGAYVGVWGRMERDGSKVYT